MKPRFGRNIPSKDRWEICTTHQSEGVTVPITSSFYGYTKVLAHTLNSMKTPDAAVG